MAGRTLSVSAAFDRQVRRRRGRRRAASGAHRKGAHVDWAHRGNGSRPKVPRPGFRPGLAGAPWL